MINTRLNNMKEYLKANIKHFLVLNFNELELTKYVTINANCDRSLLNGTYVKTEFVAPSWYNELSSMKKPILVINNIDDIDELEQRKFLEILKYNKISTFELPQNCVIIVTCSSLNINREVFSLLVRV